MRSVSCFIMNPTNISVRYSNKCNLMSNYFIPQLFLKLCVVLSEGRPAAEHPSDSL